MKKVYVVKKTDTTFWSVKNSVTAFFLLMVLICFALGLVNKTNRDVDDSWIPVDGFVLHSELETHMIEGLNKGNPSSLFYDSNIHYQYDVNGQTFTGSYVLGGVNKNDPAMAQHNVDSYPQGTVIRIFYNPADPKKSMIDISSDGRSLAFFLAGMVFLLCAVLAYRLIKEKTPVATVYRKTMPSAPRIEKPSEKTNHLSPSDSPSEISGKWTLDYQIPSMREIISSSHGVKNAQGNDMKAVLASGSETLTVTITSQEIEFKYKDDKNQGSCDILSRYELNGNTLSLEHKSMDFLMADIEDFPPKSYTYKKNGSKLTLVSNEIQGLGKRKISYHLTRSE